MRKIINFIILSILLFSLSLAKSNNLEIILKAKWGDAEGEFAKVVRADLLLFPSPGGMALDKEGNIYIVDTFNQRIQKFNSEGHFLAKFGSKGYKDGEFQYPRAICLDSQGNIWIGDQTLNNVQKFNHQGKFILRINLAKNSKLAQITFHPINENLLVSDISLRKILIYDHNGNLKGEFSVSDSGKNLYYPSSLAVSKNGKIFIHAFNNQQGDRILVFDENNRLIREIGGNSKTTFKKQLKQGFLFHQVLSLSIDDKNNLYIADPIGVVKFNAYGKLLAVLSTLPHPSSPRLGIIALDYKNNLYLLNGTGISFGVILAKIPLNSSYWKKY